MALDGVADEPSTTRLIYRFAIGSASLGWEGLGDVLRAHAAALAGAERRELKPPSAFQLVVAALLHVPDLVQGVLDGSRSLSRTLPGRVGTKVFHLLARSPAGRATQRWTDQIADVLGKRAADLMAEGRIEEALGRAASRDAYTSAVAHLLARLANSAELQSLIKEQSAGLGRDALDQFREQTERADDGLESWIRKITGRGTRFGRPAWDGGAR